MLFPANIGLILFNTLMANIALEAANPLAVMGLKALTVGKL
jgi:hypothetical protein